MKKQDQGAEPGDQREKEAGLMPEKGGASTAGRGGASALEGAGPPGKWAGRAFQDGAGSLRREGSLY